MNIEISEIAKESESLFKEAREILLTSQNSEVKDFAQTIPQTFMKEDEKVKVVFCGQYSAGKSTILSILTGVNLETGGGVTTGEIQKLDWNSISVYDTPGIHTQMHPDHDAITYDAIAKSDLLIFVLTNEGFSNNLGKHFRHLIFDMKKGHELMLVVNKMECCAQGNTEESQSILAKDIEKVSSPLLCKELYTTFVDAQSYNNSITETDEESKTFFKEISNFDTLERNINQFVKDKGLMGKYAQNLYQVERILDQALSKYRSGNTIIDGAIKLCDDKIKKYEECKDSIASRLKKLKYDNNQEVHKIGDKTAHSITEKSKKDAITKTLSDAQKAIEDLLVKMNDDTVKIVVDECSKLESGLKDLQNNEFVKDIQFAIGRELNNRLSISKEQLDKINSIVEKIGNIGEIMFQNCLKKGVTSFSKLKDMSGSKVHEIVKNVGHWFGHKFKPWEVVKNVDKIGKFSQYLSFGSALLGPILQTWSEDQENKETEQICKARDEVWRTFDEEAQVIDMKFDESTNTWIQDNLMSEISNLRNQKTDLQNTIRSKEKEQFAIEGLISRVRTLIDRIHDMSKK